jgi:ABC-type transporter Mla maintaining outer membrane lipid asymmetry ATPase subunit MlaF
MSNNPPPVIMSDLAIAHPKAAGHPIIKGVNWRVESGDVWVIAGLQSSGKSRLLESIAGLHPVLSGRIEVYGHDLSSETGDKLIPIRQRVGVVFEGTGRLFPNLTVFENIALPWCYHHNALPEEAISELQPLITALGIERVCPLLPARLSLGWAHRVALARAIVMKPDLILMDNPLSGLDPAQERWWRALLEQFMEGHPWFDGRPLTLIIASDELRIMLNVGRQFAMIHDGGMHILGGREELNTERHPMLRELLHDSMASTH